MINKRAGKWLPDELQSAINTFIEQFNIMEEHNLETIPTEYSISLLETMRQYPEYNNILLELITILEEGLA